MDTALLTELCLHPTLTASEAARCLGVELDPCVLDDEPRRDSRGASDRDQLDRLQLEPVEVPRPRVR